MSTIIEVQNLIKHYNKEKQRAVDEISFSVEKGEFFAFLGPNGAGKTTTISILTTTLSKTSGEVKVAGFDVELEARLVRENAGIIFQSPSLDIMLSAEENIRFHACLYGLCTYKPAFSLMPQAYKKRVLDLAEIMGISDSLFKPIRKLSGGMQRKLEIIRSLIHTPDILFLDEPTQGLDALSRRNLWEYIHDVQRETGMTVFLTTHYIDEAEKVDRVCIINHGKISFCGSPETMKESFLERKLIIDSDNRELLVSELADLNLLYKVEQHIVVSPQDKPAQDIIASLQSRLSLLRISEPTLEDAYIEHLAKDNCKQEGKAA